MKINWKVRFKNPVFWANLAAAILLPILAALGLNWNDMTKLVGAWERASTGRSEPCNCGVCDRVRLESDSGSDDFRAI